MTNFTNSSSKEQTSADKNKPLTWSFGLDIFDNRPINYRGDKEGLKSFIDDNRAPYKGKHYITSAMLPEGTRVRGKRSKENALPRGWLAFDMDGNLTDSDFAQAVHWFERFDCFIYETASSKKNARRFRVLLLLSRPVVEMEAKTIGELVQKASGFEGWDSSTHRCAQPVFLPPAGNELIDFNGQLLNVEEWLAKAPPKPRIKPRKLLPQTTENIFGWFANNAMVLSVGGAMHKVVCPWSNLHSDGRVEAALFEPSNENNLCWGFKCLHAHCVDKGIKDIYRLIKGVV